MFTVLLDTSVLWPSLQRDFLLSLAIEGMYRPAWSAAILGELEYHETAKLIKRGNPTDEAAQRAHRLVGRCVPHSTTPRSKAGKGWKAPTVCPTRTTNTLWPPPWSPVLALEC